MESKVLDGIKEGEMIVAAALIIGLIVATFLIAASGYDAPDTSGIEWSGEEIVYD